MPIRVPELRQMIRTMGVRPTCQHITESLQLSAAGEIGHLRPSDFSVRDLAEGLVEGGREWVRAMDPSRGDSIMESMDAIDSTAFSNITGQLIINEIMAAYENPAFAISGMFRTLPSRLSGERIPGIGGLEDKTESVGEGQPFPHVGLGEDYIDTPATDKKGLIVPVTKEAVFFDRTGLLLERARDVGKVLRTNKEKRCIDVLIGKVNNYKWKGTAYNTYQSSGTPWANELTGAANDLEDWTDLDAVEQLFSEMKDPNTDEPIMLSGSQLIATPAKNHHINRITNATEIRYTGSGAKTETLAANPLQGYTGTTSAWLYSRLQSELGLTAEQAKATYFMGDPSSAFRYVENWPVTVVQAPQNSEAEFNQDIVARFKASERGVAAVFDPRYMVRVKGFDA